MIRAIFFDFYGVWLPDIFSEYLTMAQQNGPLVVTELETIVRQYFHGEVTLTYVADSFRFKLSRPEIDVSQFVLKESDISPAVTDFMRNLHGHFVKLGVLANLGTQEYELLNSFNERTQLFEVITGPLPQHTKALQTIGEPPRSCLLVTGNVDYAAFAATLGIQTLPFDGLPQLQQTLEQLLSSEMP